jgi:hypothetical protein
MLQDRGSNAQPRGPQNILTGAPQRLVFERGSQRCRQLRDPIRLQALKRFTLPEARPCRSGASYKLTWEKAWINRASAGGCFRGGVNARVRAGNDYAECGTVALDGGGLKRERVSVRAARLSWDGVMQVPRDARTIGASLIAK